MSLTPAEQMLLSATRITTYRNGTPLAFGTGFFYAVTLDDGRSTVLLVTNRHVFADCDRIDISLAVRGADGLPRGDFQKWELNFVGTPIGHPDPKIDLAVISITELHRINGSGAREDPFYVTLRKEDIPNEETWASFDAIEEVTMVGCPNGLFDEVNNLPLTRRGITATHPSKNYQGREEFMVDLACFPGSSGSPVFLYSTGATYDRGSGGFSLGTIRMFFLGILYGGPTINQRGEIVLTQQPSVAVTSMMHLGLVIKATQLFAFETLVRRQLGIE